MKWVAKIEEWLCICVWQSLFVGLKREICSEYKVERLRKKSNLCGDRVFESGSVGGNEEERASEKLLGEVNVNLATWRYMRRSRSIWSFRFDLTSNGLKF